MSSAAVAGLVWWSGDGPVRAVETPELRAAPEPLAALGTAAATEEGARSEAGPEIRIGDFERPEEVPEYEILDERRNRRDGARGAWLLIDTRAHSEEEYVLITRHLKVRYANLDAVSIEFIDLRQALRYNGGALIFNTTAGVGYIGYFHGPPNNKGYYVKATD
ncbi:hypothetical protein GBA63_07250 [Rubrobacter tropicus]|uniref:Uncharacterized protein n=1 Tax=Rubrobacter tropicus TaxID=2653851 RepID=A0A6G8Q7K3_9ACTN|nr:hypothetical protein [Rubrobacter tropicus]QIN82464.1 hypothetical protein GBA63_07250 [Rubrobacter tropicus]